MNIEWLVRFIEQIHWAEVGIWAGLVGFSFGLSFLLWTRWGNYHLIAKCILFSMLAHLVLGLLLTTAGVVDSVQEAIQAASQDSAMVVQKVHIDKQPDDMFVDSETDGRSEEPLSVSEFDRPTNAITLDSPSLVRTGPEMQSSASVERPVLGDQQALPKQTPKPEITVAPAKPDEPQVARSVPEAPDRTETTVKPEESVATAADSPKEVLPENRPVKSAPVFGTGPVARTKQSGTPDGAAEKQAAKVPLRVSPKFPVAGPVTAPEGPPRPIASTPSTDPDRKRGTNPNIPGPPIATPDSVAGAVGPNRSGPDGVATPPSTVVRPSFSTDSVTGKEAAIPSRSGSPGGDGLPLPPGRAGIVGTSPSPRSDLPTPAAVRPIGPVASGAKTADREGVRLGTPEIYRNRTSPNKSDVAVARGGSKASEEAVDRALQWLAAHQQEDGHWDADDFSANCPAGDVCTGPGAQTRDDCALTGLVLLAYLGAGNTHLEGKYSKQVLIGLNWLLAQRKSNGDLRGPGKMYSQGIATLALSEALGMSKDPRLREPVERSVKFVLEAQNPSTGGWRYAPGQYGDTSIFGWQLMALKSAALAGIEVPTPTWERARGWLDLVGSGRHRGLASYLPTEAATPTMTAEALACRLFLGTPLDNPAVREAADYLLNYSPQWSRQNLYYWYYGTLANFQMGGDYWQKWNSNLRDPLIAHQVREGHAAGSWDTTGDPWGREGGRIYTTTLSTLCLEVYYRFLPLQSLLEETSPQVPASRPPAPATARQPGRP